MRALEAIFAELSAEFPLPVAVVHHRGPAGGSPLRMIYQKRSALRLREPQDKEEIRPGHIYLAPADYHLMVEDGHFSLSTEGRVSYARPSIDVLFESAAYACGPGVIAVAMTGANYDGAQGAAAVKEQGGVVIVEDPKTAECPVLPNSVLGATQPDQILPLSSIAPCLIELASGRGARVNSGPG
jgi:two-component system chemotaxis response regulator CheB